MKTIKAYQEFEAKYVVMNTNPRIQYQKVTSPSIAVEFIIEILQDLPFNQEHAVLLALNSSNQIIGYRVISTGHKNGTFMPPDVIFKILLDLGATGFITAHNHPSGNLAASNADIQMTKNISELAKLFDIKFYDSFIVSSRQGYSKDCFDTLIDYI